MSSYGSKRKYGALGVTKWSSGGKKAKMVVSNVRVAPVPRPLIGFPKDKIIEMRYCSFKTLTATSGVRAEQAVRANDIYDPDATGGGHQALGHDQWAQFYKSYIVLSSRIAVTVMQSSGQTVPQVTGVYHSSDFTGAATSYDGLIEQGKSHYCVTNPSTAITAPVIRNSYDAATFYNVKDVKDNADRIGAVMGASPTTLNYFIIWTQGSDQSTTAEVKVLYAITYKVILTDPQELTQS